MLRFLRNLFSRPNGAPVATPAVQTELAAVPDAPPAEAMTPPSAPPLPQPEPALTAPEALSKPGLVKIAISAVLPGVPEELRHKLSPHSGRHLLVPTARVTPQLAGGAVSLPLGELRRFTPDVLGDIGLDDECEVNLPLQEVLPQLGPEHYRRRTNQKKVLVPDEITGIFEKDGQNVTMSALPPKQEPPKPAPAPAQSAPAMARSAPAPISFKPATTGPIPFALPPATPVRPPPPQPTLPALPACAPLRVVQPSPVMATDGVPASSLPPARAAEPGPSAPARQVQPSSPTDQEALRLPLSQVSGNWAEEVRRDIANLNLEGAHLALPLDVLEQALKTGQVRFPWKRLCGWTDPRVASAPTAAAGEVLVDLPLKVITPLFMRRYHTAPHQRKTEVGADIPDVFGKNAKQIWGFTTPPTPTTPALAAAAVAPVAAPSAAFAPAVAAHALAAPRPAAPAPAFAAAPAPAPVKAVEPAVDLNAVLGPPQQRYAARDIVLNTAKLPGALGALLAMNDGLLVASSVPPQVKGEMVAAFLPQIYGRMGQYTRELSMGSLRGLTFTVDAGNWQVVKETNIYFAVLCRPDKALPLGQLAAIAAELNQQQQ
jgi:predicted regulator of Ras-like GTPase activity (Roadblock/LC7/MglB family)